ncbi:MAG: MFS transporter [Oscillospiraceae bacterium]|nr:MFS transporter [Oscillospiraceae bacterium]
MSQKEKRIKHPLINTFITVKGNPRIALYTEPLWTIPFNLYTPFVAVYMAALLLTDIQIGIVASVFLFVQTIAALFSGAITDKLGRRKTTFIFDVLSWTIPCLLWAFSQNFWWFVVGASFNGLMQVTTNSWTCLLVEDAKKDSLVRIFSLLHLISQTSVIFAPLAALLVNQLSIIPALRILYFFSFVSMTIKFIILYKYGGETEVGKVRMKETKGMSIWKIMGGYGKIFIKIFTSGDMILALVITTVFNITAMVHGNFFGLYVTGTLNLPQHYLAYFPILRSAVIFIFIYLFQHKMDKLGFRNPMLIGLSIFIVTNVLLIFARESSFFIESTILSYSIYEYSTLSAILSFLSFDNYSTFVLTTYLFFYVILDAVAFSFVMPRSDSLRQMLIEPSERARISGLMMVIVLGLSIPFGWVAGWLSNIDRRFPFILIIIFLIIIFAVILASKERLMRIKTS